MANATRKVREILDIQIEPITLGKLKELTELNRSEISMALCHLRKMGHVERQLINNTGRGRKTIWAYTYIKDES